MDASRLIIFGKSVGAFGTYTTAAIAVYVDEHFLIWVEGLHEFDPQRGRVAHMLPPTLSFPS